MPKLAWSPVYKVLEEKLQTGDRLILLIVPFIKLEAVSKLLRDMEKANRLQVIVRWRAEDLISGASDLEVYEFLREHGIPLYFNNSIHLKLYIFESNHCFASSANLTLSGLGYFADGNLEVGNIVRLTLVDWEHIYRIIEGSRMVDEGVHSFFRNLMHTVPPMPKPEFALLPEVKKLYTIASLPATESPTLLENAYFLPEAVSSQEEMRRLAHDLTIYHIPRSNDRQSFRSQLEQAFRRTPFVRDFVDYLKDRQSLHFGAANAWIHRKCEDVPLPYRWEIKDSTRVFYNWLAYFFPEITWGIPGRRSQVIYWDSTSTKGN